MSNRRSSTQSRDIMRYMMRTAFSMPRLATGSFILIPTTLIIERYLAPILIATLLANIQSGTVTIESSLGLIIVYGVAQFYCQVVGYRLNLFCVWTVQARGMQKIYDESYTALSQHSLGFFNERFVGSLVSQANRLASAYNNFWNFVTNRILFVATSIIATTVGLLFVFWQYALVTLALTIVFIIAVVYGMRFMRPRFKTRSEAYSEISGSLSDSLANMLAVKTDGREAYEERRFRHASAHMVRTELRARNDFIVTSSVYNFITALMRAAALIASVMAIEHGFANAGVVYLCLTYTFNLLQEIWGVNDILRDYYQIIGDSEDMYEIMQMPHDIVDRSSNKLVVRTGSLALEKVSFAHPETDSALFSDFNLTIPAGQKVGVVGVSGSGKTTLTKLLLRFMDLDEGCIAIDGQNIAEVTQKSLHKAVAYVPQEPPLFHRTLLENIGYSKPHATNDEIIRAAKQAHADEFITSLAEGYDTLVGERGVKLSGGQRQRVAIARAILKDAPILILDEATSALDSESEQLIQKAIENLWHNKTALVIAHRLSTIAKLDRIIVLDHGTIVEDGTHSELLAQNGTYAKLWSHQSGGFIEE